MHGGAAADIGYLLGLGGDWSHWARRDAPWECAVTGASDGTTWAKYSPEKRTVTRTNGGLWVEAWVDNTDFNPAEDGTFSFTLSWVSAGGKVHSVTIGLDFHTGSITYSIRQVNPPVETSPLVTTIPDIAGYAGRWHLGFWVAVSASGVVTVSGHVLSKYKQWAITEGDLPGITLPPGCLGDLTVRLGAIRAEAVQLSRLREKPPTDEDRMQQGKWRKGATLDAPTAPLRMIPAVSGSAWDAITEIARATLSTCEFDSAGIFRWRGPGRWQTTPDAPDLTLTSRRDIASVTATEEIDACRNRIGVKWQSWQGVKSKNDSLRVINTYRFAPGEPGLRIVWPIGGDDLDIVPPVTAGTVTANTIRFVTQDGNPVFGAMEVSATRVGGKIYVRMDNVSDKTVWLWPPKTGDATIEFSTPHIDSAVSPSDIETTDEDDESQRAYGVQDFVHDPRGWIQDDASAATLASAIRSAGAWPVPLLSDIEILADPRIELGDVVRIQDATGAALDTLAWVIGIKTSADGGGAVKQTLTLRGTTVNGRPADAGLTPDPPIEPTTKNL
ncbi:hypothetical protein [Streptomyces huiliensis]|uniref:hypothetical protein n=1 Tax=Streptomyces huiliensis TaxID=2876027 RepID=UPI001CC060A5|nr:hypothetical protein [Streptomyces huiliensis]MBZ4319540.1 hypothetical protein [Streptomyces huiliensis]